MMNRKYFIIFSFLILSFCFIKNANATNEIDQQQNASNGDSGATDNFFCQSFTPEHNNLVSLEWNCNPNTGTSKDYTVVIYQGTYPYGNNIASTNISGDICGSGNNTTNFSPEVELIPLDPYYFCITSNYNFATISATGSEVPSGYYPYGKLDHPDREDFYYQGSRTDAVFKTYYSTTFVPSIPFNLLWQIDVIVPTTDYLYTFMPTNIIFKYSNVGGVWPRAIFQIFRLTGKNGTPDLSITPISVNIASTTSPEIIGAPLNLANGYYRLYNGHFAGNGENFVYTPIDFRVLATSTHNILGNASTSLQEILTQYEETICADLDMSSISGMILCALKRAGLFMFKPNDSSITTFIQSYLEFKETFPFNAFFGITTAIQTGVATSTVAMSETVKIPFINIGTSTIGTLSVISSTSLSNLIGTKNNNTFRLSLIYFGWLLVAGIIYLTIRFI